MKQLPKSQEYADLSELIGGTRRGLYDGDGRLIVGSHQELALPPFRRAKGGNAGWQQITSCWDHP